IIECHTRGIVTSATLMANMPAFEDAVALARAHPSLGVGLHFNITEGRPVADAARVGSLLDARGEFLGTSTALLRRAMLGRLRVEEVVVELRAQVEKALEAGVGLTHVDSHKHSHALPLVAAAMARTIGDYGIRAMRTPRERWRFDPGFGSIKLIAQSIGAFALSQLCRASEETLRRMGVKTTDAFHGVARAGYWNKPWLLGLIGQLPEGVSEQMCHPGYDDNDLGRLNTRLRGSRVNELQLLTDPDVAAKLQEQGVRLIHFSAF
ncbi:MAG: carbohydrate deacetylase, partial [Blastocatellia bacterium]